MEVVEENATNIYYTMNKNQMKFTLSEDSDDSYCNSNVNSVIQSCAANLIFIWQPVILFQCKYMCPHRLDIVLFLR